MPRHSIESGQIKVRYEDFASFTSMCECGQCFNTRTWMEQGPDELQHAAELADLLYQILNERSRKNG